MARQEIIPGLPLVHFHGQYFCVCRQKSLRLNDYAGQSHWARPKSYGQVVWEEVPRKVIDCLKHQTGAPGGLP